MKMKIIISILCAGFLSDCATASTISVNSNVPTTPAKHESMLEKDCSERTFMDKMVRDDFPFLSTQKAKEIQQSMWDLNGMCSRGKWGSRTEQVQTAKGIHILFNVYNANQARIKEDRFLSACHQIPRLAQHLHNLLLTPIRRSALSVAPLIFQPEEICHLPHVAEWQKHAAITEIKTAARTIGALDSAAEQIQR